MMMMMMITNNKSDNNSMHMKIEQYRDVSLPASNASNAPPEVLVARSQVHPKPVLEALNRRAMPRQNSSSSSSVVQKEARPKVLLPVPLKYVGMVFKAAAPDITSVCKRWCSVLQHQKTYQCIRDGIQCCGTSCQVRVSGLWLEGVASTPPTSQNSVM